MTETITVGNISINYEIIRKKVKNINLHVKADGRILITANNRVSKKYIEEFIIRKADWIEKARKRFENREMNYNEGFKLEDGKHIILLGEEYTISIKPSEKKAIGIEDNSIIIYTKHMEDEKKMKALWDRWYAAFIKEVFHQVVMELYPKFRVYQIDMPVIKTRKMKTRWGSCSVYGGMITLNTALIHTPLECIQYVAAHELTHFLQPNHSRKFYQMLEIIQPDYKIRKKLLENQPIYY
ncbi:DUF45 domain-containing protein [Anaerocolumna sedimenticola]|uniref:DUF45 domain-containing protein n=1 Tax=Anaerocolumna sedimenticola TaxID=2696063 RepID=A0A6P1TJU2_9FIRM|nr:SprT family zinc-dependent metalloprotease [Anaerocolumna sedimenticola]QHQ59905.1 DUF45 domain-containing protein [Anaerocolumna sedimenticola]